MTTYNLEFSYFPGCTMNSGADESAGPLKLALEKAGINFVELDDWNCCGSSPGHSVDPDLTVALGARNLSKAEPGRPIAIPCPNCYRNIAAARYALIHDDKKRHAMEADFGPINLTDPLVHVHDVFHFFNNMVKMGVIEDVPNRRSLKGLKIAAYYGCGSMYPKYLRPEGIPLDIQERLIKTMGAENISWAWPHKCCSAFASAVYPEIAERLVGQIVSGAAELEANCLVTPCAMCQMNVEMRSLEIPNLPIFHLNQLAALNLGVPASAHPEWWRLHLIDPTPLLKEAGLWD